MKLITDLNIMEGLGTCRDKQEAKAYLMANNINLSDQGLKALQAHCYTETTCKSTLTANQLSTVAGGMKLAIKVETKGKAPGSPVSPKSPRAIQTGPGRYKKFGDGLTVGYLLENDESFALGVFWGMEGALRKADERHKEIAKLRAENERLKKLLGESSSSDETSSGSSSSNSSESGSPPLF